MAENVESAPSASDYDEDEFGTVNSDSWDDEDNSDESGTEDMGQFDTKFRSLVDNKVKITETFCDHKHYVFSFALPRSPSPSAEQRLPEPAYLAIQNDSVELPPPACESTIHSARDEVTHLRTAREVFLAHKREVGERLKQEDSETGVRWLYECEEAVEAIDTIIDYKNEIICAREDASSPQLFQDRNGEDTDLIMARWANLSPVEQRRLFCKFFHKVVELRHSSKGHERNADQLTADNEDLLKVLRHYKRKSKKKEEAYSDRVKLLTVNHSGNQYARDDKGRPSDDTRSRHRHQVRLEPQSSSRGQRHNGGVYESTRDRHRDRHNHSGPEITREPHKIIIHNQNSH